MKRKHSNIVAPPPALTTTALPKPQLAPEKTSSPHAWRDFWFTPVSPIGLHGLRVMAGLLFLAWLIPFAGDVEAFFGQAGWFDREAYLRLSSDAASMMLNWSLLYAAGSNTALLHVFFWTAIVVFLLFTLGVATRITSVLTWLFVVSLPANPAMRYDVDYLLGILAFYLMIGYVLMGQWSEPLSVMGRLVGTRDTLLFGSGVRTGMRMPSYAANLAIRLLQVHFALIVVASGLHKLQSGAWWSGTAFWYPLHPPFTTTEGQIRNLYSSREGYFLVLSVSQYAALAWQLAFPLFAWRRGWSRFLLLGGAIIGWLGCWLVYQLPLFGPFYVICCLGYLTPAEWLSWGGLRSHLLGRIPFRRVAMLLLTTGAVLLSAGCPPTDPHGRKSTDPEPPAVKPVIQEDLPPTAKDPAEKSSVLRTRVDAALQIMHNRVLSLDHSFWTVFHEILGIGPESAYLQDYKTGERIKAIDYICSGGKMRGLEFIPKGTGRLDVLTLAGSGTTQGHQDQFVSEMIQWGLPLDKKMMVQGKEYTFGAFTLYSKERTSVKAGQELSWAIIIVGSCYGTDITWTNFRGETLHYEDVVRYELHQEIKDSPACGGTHRLFGLTWAYHLHLKNGGKKTGVWEELEKVTNDYKKLAKDWQNPDGSFSTAYFRGPGNNQTDLTLRIHSTGHIFEWLALAMTDKELREPWMENAAYALTAMILNNRDQGLDGGAVYHAVHGLGIYRNRVFGPTPHPPLIPLPPG